VPEEKGIRLLMKLFETISNRNAYIGTLFKSSRLLCYCDRKYKK